LTQKNEIILVFDKEKLKTEVKKLKILKNIFIAPLDAQWSKTSKKRLIRGTYHMKILSYRSVTVSEGGGLGPIFQTVTSNGLRNTFLI